MPEDNKNLEDYEDMEKLHFTFNISEEKLKEQNLSMQKIRREYVIPRAILFFLTISGVVFFFILLYFQINLFLILIDLVMTLSYVLYAIFLHTKYKRKIKHIIIVREAKINERINTIQILFYSIIIFSTITILILSLIGVDPLILMIVIGISIVYIYFDDRKD
jgi:hypothetical protein